MLGGGGGVIAVLDYFNTTGTESYIFVLLSHPGNMPHTTCTKCSSNIVG